MLKVRNERFDLLYDRKISHEHQVKFYPMEEGKKISIMSDTMFKAIFYNENRIKYSSKLISYYLEVSYEDLLNNLILSKGELDKEKEFDKGERSDYVASFNGTSINIEINKNDSLKILNRNMEYAHRLFAKKIKRGNKNNYQYTQVIQFNINNFSFEGIDKIVDVYAPRNKDGIILDDKIIFIQIYIPNLIKKWYNQGIESLS